MSITARLVLVLLDGKPHHASEFMDFLMEAVDPAVATRSYISSRNVSSRADGYGDFDPSMTPVEHMVRKGRRQQVISTLSSMTRDGFVEVHRAQDKGDDFHVALTSAGYEHFLHHPRGTPLGIAMNVLKTLLKQGRVTISVTPTVPHE